MTSLLRPYARMHTYPGGDSGYPKADEVDETVWEKRVSAWLAKYLKGKDVNTGPEVEWQAPDGYYYKAPRWPLPGTRRRVMKHVATGPLVSDPGATGGDGATDGNPAPRGEIGSTAARITIKKISRTARRRPLLGVPVVKLTGRVTGPSEAYVFLELVDIDRDGRMVTVDDQTMPVKLQPGAVKKRVKLHGVSWLLRPGHKLALEVSTASKQYDEARSTYVVDLKAVTKLPIAKARWVKSSRRTR